MIRVLSAAVIIAIVLATIWLLPPWVTAALAALVAAVAAGELAGLSAKVGAAAPPLLLAGAAAVVTAAFALPALGPPGLSGVSGDALPSVLLAVVVASGAVMLGTTAPAPAAIGCAAVAFMAPLYIGLPLGALAWVRAAQGPFVVTLLLVLVAVSDSAQYYTGRLLGRRKLSPVVSPGKTVEGAVGGLVAAGVVGATLGARWVPGVTPALGAMGGVVLAAVGIVGDLFKSLLKRAAGVKDSSALIPGHGGVLDRIDAYLFAAPVYYLLLRHLG